MWCKARNKLPHNVPALLAIMAFNRLKNFTAPLGQRLPISRLFHGLEYERMISIGNIIANQQLGLIAEPSDNLEGTINNVTGDRFMATMMCRKATLVISESIRCWQPHGLTVLPFH